VFFDYAGSGFLGGSSSFGYARTRVGWISFDGSRFVLLIAQGIGGWDHETEQSRA